MKRLWSHKWIVVVGAMVIVLSFGAIAWAATGSSDPSAAAPTTQTTPATGTGTQTDPAAPAQPGAKLKQLRQKVKQRVADRLAQQEALIKLVREKMTPEDQAKLDQLLANAKQERDAMQQAKQTLQQTLKDIRDLTKKYLPATTTTTSSGAATPATTVTPVS